MDNRIRNGLSRLYNAISADIEDGGKVKLESYEHADDVEE